MSSGATGPTVLMVAGEASGDALGGALLEALRDRFSPLRVLGVGGPRMRAAGLEGRYDINDLSVMGIVEVVRRLPHLIRVFRHLTALLQSQRPCLLLTIDFPDFNFMLAKRARRLGIPVIHYVSPQVWAWRRYRIHHLARLLDHLLVLFPFETDCYAPVNLPVTFVGHPLVRETASVPDPAQARRQLALPTDQKLVAILPGSRTSELKRLLDPMMRAAYRIAQAVPGVRFALALANTLTPEQLRVFWPVGADVLPLEAVLVVQGQTRTVVRAADAALVTSGTATLETALLGTPLVVAYRVNQITYWLGRMLVRVPYMSLVNLVAQQPVVPERLQDDATPFQLAADIVALLNQPEQHARQVEQLRAVRDRLSATATPPVDVIAPWIR